MAHVILTGATGLVGSGVLNQLLTQPSSRISHISIVGRKNSPLAEGKSNVTFYEHKDFLQYPPELLDKLKGANAVIWALGISQTQVSKEEYDVITEQYALAAAKAFAGLNEKFNFVYVSGEGATPNPGLFSAYFAGVKGRTELALNALMKEYPSLRTYSMRPAMVDARGDPNVLAVQNARRGFGKKAVEATMSPVIRTAMPSFHSDTAWLGKFLIDLALRDGEAITARGMEGSGRIIPNKTAKHLSQEWTVHQE